VLISSAAMVWAAKIQTRLVDNRSDRSNRSVVELRVPERHLRFAGVEASTASCDARRPDRHDGTSHHKRQLGASSRAPVYPGWHGGVIDGRGGVATGVTSS